MLVRFTHDGRTYEINGRRLSAYGVILDMDSHESAIVSEAFDAANYPQESRIWAEACDDVLFDAGLIYYCEEQGALVAH